MCTETPDNIYKLFITTQRLIFQIYNVVYYHDIVNFGSRAFMSSITRGEDFPTTTSNSMPLPPSISPFPMHIT
jgi:hypothetical protein